MRKYAIATVAAAVAMAVSGAAHAAIANDTFNVTVDVVNNCVVTATDLNFGTFSAAANVLGASNVAVNCTNGTNFTVALSGGSSGVRTARTMTGAGTLNYNLYTTAARNVVWGNGTDGALQSGTGAGMLNAVNFPVYGLLPLAGNENAPVGAYSDTITVDVTY